MKSSRVWTKQLIFTLIIWYLFSFITIFINKRILTYDGGDPILLGSIQLICCTICSCFRLPPIAKNPQTASADNHRLPKLVIIVGFLRFSTLILGLLALNYATVSFAETVKSSAPVFTVIISRVILHEPCSGKVILSLIPIIIGMSLCSAFEIDLNLIALVASLATNFSECFQNVFSKKLLSGERIDPHHIQYITGLSSLIIQVPCLILLVDWSNIWEKSTDGSFLLISYIVAGLSFHCQSISEYILLEKISPVTHSVANSVKRALFIWISVRIFGNEVTLQSWIGIALVMMGVLLYNKARQFIPSNDDEGDREKLVLNVRHI